MTNLEKRIHYIIFTSFRVLPLCKLHQITHTEHKAIWAFLSLRVIRQFTLR